EVEHAPGVVRDGVMDLRRWEAGRIRHARGQRHLVRFVGEILAEQPPVGAVPEVGADVEVVVRTPDLSSGAARERRVDGAARRRESPAGAADEAALLVRLVELERLDEVPELALPARQRL